MKTYKTWEVIKMLTENPKLRFEMLDKKLCTQTISIDKCKNLIARCKGCNGKENCNLSTDDKWVLAQQQVSFIEAIESCKPIRVEHEYFCMHGNYAYTNHLLMKIGDILLPDQIKEVIRDGKWYIKEDGEETASTDKTKFIKITYKDLRDHERHTKYFSTQEEYEKWHEENWNDVVING